jgi:hypothetical protein
VERLISSRDSLIWSVRGTHVDFSSPDAVPYSDFTSSVSWLHQFSPLTDFFNTLQFQWLTRESGSDSYFLRANSGVQTRLTKNLTFRGSVGVVGLRSTQDNPPPFVPSSSDAVSWVADLNLIYRLRTSSFALFAAQTVGPDSLGDTLKRQTVGARFQQQINERSGFSLAAAFSRQDDGGSDVLSTSATYSYRLSREWQSHLSYRYAHRSGGDGSASANTISFHISRDWTVMP